MRQVEPAISTLMLMRELIAFAYSVELNIVPAFPANISKFLEFDCARRVGNTSCSLIMFLRRRYSRRNGHARARVSERVKGVGQRARSLVRNTMCTSLAG